MTDARVSQVAVEVIRTNLAPTADVSQLAVEVLRLNIGRLYTLSGGVGSFSLTAKSASFKFGVAAQAGAFILSANNASLNLTFRIGVLSDVLILSGQSASLDYEKPRTVIAAAGEYIITGLDAFFARSGKSGSGSFSLVGKSSAGRFARAIGAGKAGFAITGKDASLGLTTGSSVYAARGMFFRTGKDAFFHVNHVFRVSAGSCAISFGAAGFRRRKAVKAQKGTFSASGIATQLRRPKLIFSVSPGEYRLICLPGYPFRPSGGPFYFAWADANEPTFKLHHMRYDEPVFSFSITHEEGQIPVLEVEMRNPRVGLLNSARRQWAWFSWNDGLTTHPLFFGRLVGIPGDMLGEVVKLQFIARANDYLTQKNAVGQSLKVQPYYDPLYLDEKSREDADAILEGYSASWHVDRNSLAWSISDIIVPEDGTILFDPADIYYDSVRISVGQPPLKSVHVSTNVHWENALSASVNVGSWFIPTYLGDSLLSEWPKPGASIGGGWVADQAWAIDLAGVQNAAVTTYMSSYTNRATSHAIGDTMSANISEERITGFNGQKHIVSHTVDAKIASVGLGYGDDPSAYVRETTEYALEYLIWCGLSLKADATRSFAETLKFTLTADVQNVLFDVTSEQETETIEINAGDVTATEYYFPTDRGTQSLEYLLMRARARLLTRARAIEIGWQTNFFNGVGLSCRKGAQISDDRIPGGAASGKIISYKLTGDGSSGQFLTDVRIGVAVGKGASAITPDAGMNSYADGYVQTGYAISTGAVFAIGQADLGYSPITIPTNDMSLNTAINSVWEFQQISTAHPFYKAALSLTVPDIANRSFSTLYEVLATNLCVPQGIDLGAANVS